MLSLGLKAKNSKGLQHLFIDTDDDDRVFLTLVGLYEDKPIQIDFDSLSDQDVKDFITLLNSRKAQPPRPR